MKSKKQIWQYYKCKVKITNAQEGWIDDLGDKTSIYGSSKYGGNDKPYFILKDRVKVCEILEIIK